MSEIQESEFAGSTTEDKIMFDVFNFQKMMAKIITKVTQLMCLNSNLIFYSLKHVLFIFSNKIRVSPFLVSTVRAN